MWWHITHINVHQKEEAAPDVFDSNETEAGFEEQSLRATDRQAGRACQITLMWDKIIMSHHRLIWLPQTAIGLLAKQGSVADG